MLETIFSIYTYRNITFIIFLKGGGSAGFENIPLPWRREFCDQERLQERLVRNSGRGSAEGVPASQESREIVENG